MCACDITVSSLRVHVAEATPGPGSYDPKSPISGQQMTARSCFVSLTVSEDHPVLPSETVQCPRYSLIYACVVVYAGALNTLPVPGLGGRGRIADR